jgi:hypothetical protein
MKNFPNSSKLNLSYLQNSMGNTGSQNPIMFKVVLEEYEPRKTLIMLNSELCTEF